MPHRQDWRSQLGDLIRDIGDLPPEFRSMVEKTPCFSSYFSAIAAGSGKAPGLAEPPLGISRHYLSLAKPLADDPIVLQCIPRIQELEFHASESDDPLGEARYRVLPRLVHQYPNRVLLLANGLCPGYCRHCFRRTYVARAQGFISGPALEKACDYIANKPGIQEILISGGDPLTAEDGQVADLLARLRGIRPELILRVCSRTPVTLPARFTPQLLSLLKTMRPLWLVTHFNHPAELGPAALEALAALADAGIPVLNQSVLLRGVNDGEECLAELFQNLVAASARPYYLFLGDLAQGTAHFRVDLTRALGIYKGLSARISGLALPSLALDLPGGGGKLRLYPGCAIDEAGDNYILRDGQGREFRYPKSS